MQTFTLAPNKDFLEERITFRASSGEPVEIREIETGFLKRIAGAPGNVDAVCANDRFIAVPFRSRASDAPGYVHDYPVSDIIKQAGYIPVVDYNLNYGRIPSRHRMSDGWAWIRGKRILGIYKFNQERIEFSALSTIASPGGIRLRFGGSCLIPASLDYPLTVKAGESISAGVMRYYSIEGVYNDALYAFRGMLDEFNCSFPAGYNPPVHWNELYDNLEWAGVSTPGSPAKTRAAVRGYTYTKGKILEEARKAKEYSCGALYLDPGWDTKFGSFLWGTEWLGPVRRYIDDVKRMYGLETSLHCPLGTWMSHKSFHIDSTSYAEWSPDAVRMDSEGKPAEKSVCLGSRQYLDEAERRLLELCANGVTFLMFDGNWWCECFNPNHGHPVPYTFEDHCRANVDLAQRIHKKYPDVLIEMHDMLTGGSHYRQTPVYYKYSLPGSYDENWGFELMWTPFKDLLDGRGKMLYYYNMGCNIPLYLHVDLRTDNEHCFVVWWYASTIRHLGIGGTHDDPHVVQNQINAMRKYKELERFYKRGIFLGISEEIHLHVLPEENAFTVNLFNMSDERRFISGRIAADKLGIDMNRWYAGDNGYLGHFDKNAGTFEVHRELEPWGTAVAYFHAVP